MYFLLLNYKYYWLFRANKFNVVSACNFDGRCIGLYLDEIDSNQLIIANKKDVIIGTLNENQITTKLHPNFNLNDVDCVKLVKGKIYGIIKREKGANRLNDYKFFIYDMEDCSTTCEYFAINLTDNFKIGYYNLVSSFNWNSSISKIGKTLRMRK